MKNQKDLRTPNNENNPLVSVIVPAYNHARFVKETLFAVVNQTYKPIELIILNDGSIDDTDRVICEQLKEVEENLCSATYINKQNEGVIETLNKGIEIAKGKFIFINASDDFMAPDCLKTLVSFLQNHPEYGLAVGDNGIIDDQSKTCYWNQRRENVILSNAAVYKTFGSYLQRRRADVDFLSADFGSYKSLLLGNYIPNGYLIRKICIDRAGGYHKKSKLEDWNLMLNLSKICKFKYISDVLFFYRWHSNNTIKQYGKMCDARKSVLALEKDYAIRNGYETYWKRGIQYEEVYGAFFFFKLIKKYNKRKDRFILRILEANILSFSVKKGNIK